MDSRRSPGLRWRVAATGGDAWPQRVPGSGHAAGVQSPATRRLTAAPGAAGCAGGRSAVRPACLARMKRGFGRLIRRIIHLAEFDGPFAQIRPPGGLVSHRRTVPRWPTDSPAAPAWDRRPSCWLRLPRRREATGQFEQSRRSQGVDKWRIWR